MRAGTTIRASMLTPPTIVRRGEQVTLVAASGPIRVRTEGRALRDGAARSSVELPMASAVRPGATRTTVFRVALLRSPVRGERLYLLTQDHLKATAEALGQMNQRRIEARERFNSFGTVFDRYAGAIILNSNAQRFRRHRQAHLSARPIADRIADQVLNSPSHGRRSKHGCPLPLDRNQLNLLASALCIVNNLAEPVFGLDLFGRAFRCAT